MNLNVSVTNKPPSALYCPKDVSQKKKQERKKRKENRKRDTAERVDRKRKKKKVGCQVRVTHLAGQMNQWLHDTCKFLGH